MACTAYSKGTKTSSGKGGVEGGTVVGGTQKTPDSLEHMTTDLHKQHAPRLSPYELRGCPERNKLG